MELKKIEVELLIKSVRKDEPYILTHAGFINNCDLTDGEREILHKLAVEMSDKDVAIILDEKALTPYHTSYNSGTALAGIKISKLLNVTL